MKLPYLFIVLAAMCLSCLADCDINSYDNVCLLPKVTGPCEALISRYYYNTETKRCEKFFYGGCEGNANNFESLESCENTCKCEVNVCLLPKVVGPCDGDYPRYYYNPEIRKCEMFIYGGCQGNANNFETQKACYKACKPHNNYEN